MSSIEVASTIHYSKQLLEIPERTNISCIMHYWAPECKIVYDKFHIMQHANPAIDEVRKRSLPAGGPKKRGLIKGKKLLLSRWKNLTQAHHGELNQLFQMYRRVFSCG